MKEKNFSKIIDIFISILLIVFCLICNIYKFYNRELLGIILLGLNIYMMYKAKKNRVLFFALLTILYFNYSFIITRYIGETSLLLDNLYKQLINNETMYIAIIAQIIFLSIINFFIVNIEEDKVSNITIKFKYRKLLILMIQVSLTLILIYHLISGITHNTTLLEYSIYLFIFALYYCKQDKKNKIILEIILLAFSIYSLKNGDRIAVLQFLLVDFIINYLEKFKIKYVFICLVIGIIVFTYAGLYGDFLDYGHSFEDLTLEYTVNEFKERRLALDTSVSAYWSGVSMIDVCDKYSNEFRIKNAIEYFTKYTILGSKANYTTLDLEIRDYQVNYGGGLPTCYFYFWMGWYGVIIISVYVGCIFNIISKRMNMKNNYLEMLSIFVASTIPRWYLYVPTLLFRGIILFSILYLIIYIMFLRNKVALDLTIKTSEDR